MRIAAVVLVAALLICCLRDEGVGYALLGMAAVLYFGLPLLTGQIYIWQSLRETDASHVALQGVQTVALLYGVPGLIWTAVGSCMRFRRRRRRRRSAAPTSSTPPPPPRARWASRRRRA